MKRPRRVPALVRLALFQPATLARAVAALIGVRLALQVVPFGQVRRGCEEVAARRGRGASQDAAECRTVVQALEAAGRVIPGGRHCLAQALAARVLLGEDAELRIGVRRDERGVLRAHAWVERDGEVILGGKSSRAAFALLAAL